MKGVNYVEYYTRGDKPYLITGSNDHTSKVLFVYLFGLIFSSIYL